MVVSTNVDVIQSCEESDMTEESERSSEVVAESEQNVSVVSSYRFTHQIRSDLQMGVEKPALPEKPAFKRSLNEVVRWIQLFNCSMAIAFKTCSTLRCLTR